MSIESQSGMGWGCDVCVEGGGRRGRGAGMGVSGKNAVELEEKAAVRKAQLRETGRACNSCKPYILTSFRL